MLNAELNAKQIQLKLIEKEKEVFALKAQQEEERARIESQRKENIIIISSLSILFLLMTLTIILASRIKIQAKNNLLDQRNQEILNTNKELTDSNRVKDTLFSIIGHDLKTPFVNLEQMFNLIDMKLLDEKDMDFFITELHSKFKQSNFLLNNLLEWSKTQIHSTPVSFIGFELSTIISECTYVLESSFTNKYIELELDLNFKEQIYADIDMVKLVTRNLLSNAIKFTPEAGQVCIQTFQEDTQFACIKIQDTGVGMSQEQKDKLFNKSINATTFGTNNEKGTGIGLKLSKEFIDLMNGKIEVDSTVGKGSSFSVFLPINKVD